MRYIKFLACALLLSGCVSPAQFRARAEAVAAADDERCLQYGAKPGTDAYTQCRIAVDALRQQAAANQQMQLIQAYGALQQAGRPYTLGNPIVNCSSVRAGAVVNTTCQ